MFNPILPASTGMVVEESNEATSTVIARYPSVEAVVAIKKVVNFYTPSKMPANLNAFFGLLL